jgi:hypothetical protein
VIIDLGVGMAPALVTKYLVEIGARVIRLEPATGLPELAALLATADLCDFLHPTLLNRDPIHLSCRRQDYGTT